ncbi:MAG: hypothetical protein ACI9FR_002754 [Cryomorphaceae bacterium]|jgi:hypothetical protein
MNQKRVYKSCLKEVKEEAVALINEQGFSVSKAASVNRQYGLITLYLMGLTVRISPSH